VRTVGIADSRTLHCARDKVGGLPVTLCAVSLTRSCADRSVEVDPVPLYQLLLLANRRLVCWLLELVGGWCVVSCHWDPNWDPDELKSASLPGRPLTASLSLSCTIPLHCTSSAMASRCACCLAARLEKCV
jgi:hypothetical protein